MRSLNIGPFLGMNNRRPDFSLGVKDAGYYVADAVNVEFDDVGRFRRRSGMTLVQAMTGAHSFFTDGTRSYLVRDAVLYEVLSFAPYGEALRKVLASNARVSYCRSAGDIYLSNGTDSLRIAADGAVYPWAMPSPAAPGVATIAGTLAKGRYRVALTFVNATTGEESGSGGATAHELTVDGALRITLPAAVAGATHVAIYCSTQNGGVAQLQTTVAAGTPSVDITAVFENQRQLLTEYQAPLPAGSRVFAFNGRLCAANGKRLYIGEPFRPGYYRPDKGYIDFADDISVGVPGQTGIYVATRNRTYWLQGTDPTNLETMADIAPFGAVPGTEFELPTPQGESDDCGWFSHRGFVTATATGQMHTPMIDTVEISPPASGVSAVVTNDGFRRVTGCGYNMNIATGAASRVQGPAITSASGGYLTTADGLYAFGGDTDGDAAILATVDFGRHDFGTEQLKYLPAAYIGLWSAGAVEVTSATPTGECVQFARSYDDDLRIQRVDLSRGLIGNWFRLRLANPDGCDFSVASVSATPLASKRRI